MSKESTFNAEDTGDVGSIPGSGRSHGGGNGNLLSILAWSIPWAEKPGGLQSTGSKKLAPTEHSCFPSLAFSDYSI